MLTDQRVEKLAVVELEEALVGWMRDGTVPHGPAFLADERLVVVTADVRQAMAEAAPSTYDLVLLDVDNGPGFLVHDDNAGLYREPFLRTVAAVLRPGGAVAVWSAAESPELREAMAGSSATRRRSRSTYACRAGGERATGSTWPVAETVADGSSGSG